MFIITQSIWGYNTFLCFISAITSIDYQSGGTEGGSRIKIEGTNLDASTNQHPLTVTIGGKVGCGGVWWGVVGCGGGMVECDGVCNNVNEYTGS